MIRNSNKLTRQYQTYPDGWGSVHAVRDRKIISTKQKVMHFADETVGERRFWDAQVLGVRIDRAILVPYESNVDADDLVIIDGTQYEVKQKQRHDRTLPVSWLLSLSEAVIRYRGGAGG